VALVPNDLPPIRPGHGFAVRLHRLASFIAALFAGRFIGTMFFTHAAGRFGRRTVFTSVPLIALLAWLLNPTARRLACPAGAGW
jgi:hypothetical protein